MIKTVDGFMIGNSQNEEALTGATVIICKDEGAVCSVDVRGAAPGTRETDLLMPENSVQRVNAVVLSGGSAFGLSSVTGVSDFLEEKSMGFDTGIVRVPIIPAAVLFDLGVGRSDIRPDRDMGYSACLNASEEYEHDIHAGAGCGATVAKAMGFDCCVRGGLGYYEADLGNGGKIAAIIAVNALGDIYDGSKQLAGPIDKETGQFLKTDELMANGLKAGFRGVNTTIGAVMTNIALSKSQCRKIAQMAHDGFARAICPVHTPHDGDTIFVLSSEKIPYEGDITPIGIVAQEAVRRAILSVFNLTYTV